MDPIASAGPMDNSVFVRAPHNSYPATQEGMCQVALYPSNQPQVHLLPVNPPGLKPSVSEQPVRRALKEGKALGAIQILIGLIHISLGSIMATVLSGHYAAISLYGGFPFWGGIWFIVSGSLSVSAENQPKSSCLTPGMAISGVLLIFCLLEFCVACASSHFGCQLVCCQHNYVGVVLPNICVANPGVIPEPVNLPPTYFNEVQGSR
ncbi:membrane-spanning 4-domains subfamily A member 8-like isoform X2 [Zalophus californianus]|uniref:Membrane-spanning 4-domains subfamily A member 8-like isoform X2 n=1 Tax=Zalophus californianus TaxID=9704 RepID=A0A6J2C2X9_ZALCA|nr:membrane-spanning 4-domains subfamily A member 8-like isoform X2 [Zalophus californianus]